MADAAVPQQPYVAPAAAVAHDEQEQYIQQTPVWVVAVRGVQILLSIIILGMAGFLIHGHAMGANGFAVACCVFTWIVVSYTLISEKVASARGAYNIWAVLSLDFLMALFWLASLGANAELRARFTVPVNVKDCYNDGSAISSNHCTYAKVKRAAVADALGLALMSAVAGVSALEWLLFVATLVFHGHTFRLWHQEHKKPSVDNATVEMKAQGTPMLAAQATGQPAHPQYTDQQQYQSQMYPPHEIHQQQQQAPVYSPQQQQQQQPDVYAQQAPAYPPQQQQQQPAPYAAYPDASQYQQQQQPAYSPHATPVPGQPYYPPQELQQQQQPAYSPHATPVPGQPYHPPQELQQPQQPQHQ